MSDVETYGESVLRSTLESIAEYTEEETEVYLIGGGAMMFYGLKPATKDIDIVFRDSNALRGFVTAARNAGLELVQDPGEEYERMGATVIMRESSGIQLDLFDRVVCNALEVKESVINRANHLVDVGKLQIYLMSIEDIVLFKGITEREADLEDIRTLAETGIDWGIIEEECLSQEDSGVWANLLLDKLSDLYARHGIKVRLEKVKEHADSCVLRFAFESFIGDEERNFKELYRIVKEKTGYSESWTRARLKELEEEGFIESRKAGRQKLYKLSVKQSCDILPDA